MTGTVLMSEVDAVYTAYSVLSKAENTREFLDTTECIMLHTRSRANRCRNGVQLYKKLKLKIKMY